MESKKLKQFAAGQNVAGKMCSICQSTLIAGERILYCPECSLPFHVECWDENGGCSSYGCPVAPAADKHQGEVAAMGTTNVWGGEKVCPKCRKEIKAQALKCRFCGAEFSSRDAISPEEFAKREYEGKEYAKVRNKVIALFLLCAAGCMSPLGLILVSILLFNKSAFGIEIRRLPMALKYMLYAGLGVSVFLLVLMILLATFD
jgi:hypothetical protein